MAADTFTAEGCMKNFRYIFQPDLYKGKVAFVTGGGSGIGFTIAEVFMRHGCTVAIASRNEARLKVAATTLEQATGGTCLPIKMDVRKPAEIIQAVETVLRHYKRVDILVNNAAGNFLCPIEGLSFNAFKTVMEIDTMGTFNSSKIIFDKYFKDHGGVIVNITATLAYRGTAFQAHAGSAKAAIDALTRHMAVEWGSKGVRVVGIAPGPIADTEGARKLAGDQLHLALPFIPVGRLGKRGDIANIVLFASSDGAGFISGETIVADGGTWLSSPNTMDLSRRHLQSVAGPKSKV